MVSELRWAMAASLLDGLDVIVQLIKGTIYISKFTIVLRDLIEELQSS